jgi:hypothetical protein
MYDLLHTGARRGYVGRARGERVPPAPPADVVGLAVGRGAQKTSCARGVHTYCRPNEILLAKTIAREREG